jgi:predicted transcriptional regulator
MILLIDSYTYNDGGTLKGDFYQHLFYISKGKIFEKRKRFLVEPDSFLSEFEKYPSISETSLERIMKLFNPIYHTQKEILKLLKDKKIHKFYRKYGEIVYKGIVEKVEWF